MVRYGTDYSAANAVGLILGIGILGLAAYGFVQLATR